ncbi:MAG: hypothetical protein JOZ41_07880 [Chloroflexi bacterium]|nr:hypothetical protein [Chloroflexota bacterium]
MSIQEARAAARGWVFAEVANIPDFCGAYFAGSTSGLPGDAPLPGTSDLDVNVVFSGPSRPSQVGKLVHRGVLLDVTHLSLEQLRTPDLVLGHYHLAGGFRTLGVIADPTGHLSALQAAVSRDFARRRWVRRRCEHARRRVLDGLDALDESGPFHDRVIGWLFPTGVTTHVLLVAGLRNPTVRRRYAAVRELLAERGRLGFHETLLDLLGCATLSRRRAEEHLAVLTEAFDVARGVIRSPFSFASEISEVARPLAVGGSRELIERGLHREAMFWIAVTFSRCQKVLAADAPEDLKRRFDPAYRRLLGDLGITSPADLRRRRDAVIAHLPRVWEEAEAILAATRGIED